MDKIISRRKLQHYISTKNEDIVDNCYNIDHKILVIYRLSYVGWYSLTVICIIDRR